jgi:CBS domain containing-hemolysin-like protein
MKLLIEGIALILLLILSAFFSSSETALTTVSLIKIKTLADQGNRRAKTVLKVTKNKSRMLSAILIGNNVVNLSASSLATSIAIKLLGNYGAGIATGILTFLILIFGEITPKNTAAVRPTELSLKAAGVIYVLMKVLTPIIYVVNHISIFIMKIIGVRKEDSGNALSSDEIMTLVDYSTKSGSLEQEERNYISNIFDFSDSMVKEIMVPRIDIEAVDMNWSYDKIIDFYHNTKKTRFPVYKDDRDHIVGILNIKDMVEINDKNSFAISRLMREPYFTYEQKNTADLFTEMRQNSISMAIILDEYGDVAGLITLEDLLEELVGEIRDEYDSDEVDDIVKINDCEYVVQGSTNLDDLNDVLPLDFESDDYDTLGGYLTGLFDHFPKAGETYVTKSGVILSVAKTSKRRIIKVRIKFPEPVKDELEDNE